MLRPHHAGPAAPLPLPRGLEDWVRVPLPAAPGHGSRRGRRPWLALPLCRLGTVTCKGFPEDPSGHRAGCADSRHLHYSPGAVAGAPPRYTSKKKKSRKAQQEGVQEHGHQCSQLNAIPPQPRPAAGSPGTRPGSSRGADTGVSPRASPRSSCRTPGQAPFQPRSRSGELQGGVPAVHASHGAPLKAIHPQHNAAIVLPSEYPPQIYV